MEESRAVSSLAATRAFTRRSSASETLLSGHEAHPVGDAGAIAVIARSLSARPVDYESPLYADRDSVSNNRQSTNLQHIGAQFHHQQDTSDQGSVPELTHQTNAGFQSITAWNLEIYHAGDLGYLHEEDEHRESSRVRPTDDRYQAGYSPSIQTPTESHARAVQHDRLNFQNVQGNQVGHEYERRYPCRTMICCSYARACVGLVRQGTCHCILSRHDNVYNDAVAGRYGATPVEQDVSRVTS